MSQNRSQICPVSAFKMCDEGTDGNGAMTYDWVTIHDAIYITAHAVLAGTTGTDITVLIEACVKGAECNPVTLATLVAGGTTVYTGAGCYDKFRAKVTIQGAGGENSQVYLSARK
jgi:hypothetical protein